MKPENKRRLKAAAITAYGIPVEEGLDLVANIWNATIGRAKRHIMRLYCEMLSYELNEVVKECPDCNHTWLNTRYYWSEIQDEFCDIHRDEVRRAILGHNRNTRR